MLNALVLVDINLLIKLEMPNFTRSKDMIYNWSPTTANWAVCHPKAYT